nr:hypothetical protein [uncultured Tolumonas sp.]
MYFSEEFKKILFKYINKFLFPDFTNKLTWFVVTLGGAVIIAPQPMKIIVINWLIKILNTNNGLPIKLTEIPAPSTDYTLGFGLIFLALAHNLGYKWFSNASLKLELAQKSRSVDVDINRFKEFISLLPTTGRSMYLLSSHDFGNSFSLKSLTELDSFTIEWNSPEKSFLNSDLETKRQELWSKCNEFQNLLASKSGPSHGGLQSVVPERYKDAWEWPDWVDDNVKSINEMATALFKTHQDFVLLCRSILAC